MTEINLDEMIAKKVKEGIDAFVQNFKPTGSAIRFNTQEIKGTDLMDAECPTCHAHGLVEPKIVEKVKTETKEVEKPVSAQELQEKGYIDITKADFSSLAPYLEKHQGGNNLFTCPTCEGPAWDWLMKQKGFSDWANKHGYKMVKK